VKHVPLFLAKKEVFAWLKSGAKTIDVRKGTPWKGEIAIFQSGASYLEFPIVTRETGTLEEVIRQENFMAIIPTARTLEEARNYLRRIYQSNDGGIYTAYHLGQPKKA
jgi:ASC-1-like (ASCH) protein